MKLIEILEALQRSNLQPVDISPLTAKSKFQARVITNTSKSSPANAKFILIECRAAAKSFVTDFKKLCKSYIDEIKSLQTIPQPIPSDWEEMLKEDDYGTNSKNFLIDTETLKSIFDGKKLKPKQSEAVQNLIVAMGASMVIQGSELQTPRGSAAPSPSSSGTVTPASSAPSSRESSPPRTPRESKSPRAPATPQEAALASLGKKPNAVICTLLSEIFQLLVQKGGKIEESTFLHDEGDLSRYSKDMFFHSDMKIFTDSSDNMIIRFIPRTPANIRNIRNFFEKATALVENASGQGGVVMENTTSSVSLSLNLLLQTFQQLEPSVGETITSCQRIVNESIAAFKKKKQASAISALSPRPAVTTISAPSSAPPQVQPQGVNSSAISSVPPTAPHPVSVPVPSVPASSVSSDPAQEAQQEQEKRKAKEERKKYQQEQEQLRQQDLSKLSQRTGLMTPEESEAQRRQKAAELEVQQENVRKEKLRLEQERFKENIALVRKHEEERLKAKQTKTKEELEAEEREKAEKKKQHQVDLEKARKRLEEIAQQQKEGSPQSLRRSGSVVHNPEQLQKREAERKAALLRIEQINLKEKLKEEERRKEKEEDDRRKEKVEADRLVAEMKAAKEHEAAEQDRLQIEERKRKIKAIEEAQVQLEEEERRLAKEEERLLQQMEQEGKELQKQIAQPQQPPVQAERLEVAGEAPERQEQGEKDGADSEHARAESPAPLEELLPEKDDETRRREDEEAHQRFLAFQDQAKKRQQEQEAQAALEQSERDRIAKQAQNKAAPQSPTSLLAWQQKAVVRMARRPLAGSAQVEHEQSEPKGVVAQEQGITALQQESYQQHPDLRAISMTIDRTSVRPDELKAKLDKHVVSIESLKRAINAAAFPDSTYYARVIHVLYVEAKKYEQQFNQHQNNPHALKELNRACSNHISFCNVFYELLISVCEINFSYVNETDRVVSGIQVKAPEHVVQSDASEKINNLLLAMSEKQLSPEVYYNIIILIGIISPPINASFLTQILSNLLKVIGSKDLSAELTFRIFDYLIFEYIKKIGNVDDHTLIPIIARAILPKLRHYIDILKSKLDFEGSSFRDDYMAVLLAFEEELQQCQNEWDEHSQNESKLKEINKKVITHADNFAQFYRLLSEIVVIPDELENGSTYRIRSASQVDTHKISVKANKLIDGVAIKGFYGVALSIANFLVKALTAIGIPITTMGAGAYAGAIIGGIVGAPTVTFTGPAGVVVAASAGAWIGGGAGFLTGASASSVATRKVGFFKPVNTTLQYFAEELANYARHIQAAKIASPAA